MGRSIGNNNNIYNINNTSESINYFHSESPDDQLAENLDTFGSQNAEAGSTDSTQSSSSFEREGFLLLAQAAELCTYSQEYLSLLARKGQLRAEKFGRNWYTRAEWLAEYVQAHSADRKGHVKGEFKDDELVQLVVQDTILTKPAKDVLLKSSSVLETVRRGYLKVFSSLESLFDNFSDRALWFVKTSLTRLAAFKPTKKVRVEIHFPFSEELNALQLNILKEQLATQIVSHSVRHLSTTGFKLARLTHSFFEKIFGAVRSVAFIFSYTLEIGPAHLASYRLGFCSRAC